MGLTSGVVAPLESATQKAFFEYLKTVAIPQQPGVTLYDVSYAIPNGAMLAGSDKQRARYMNFLKAQGLKPGVPDVCIACPVGRWHGAYVELKRGPKAKVSDAQAAWIALLGRMGYYAAIAPGLDSAIEHIKAFMREGDRV